MTLDFEKLKPKEKNLCGSRSADELVQGFEDALSHGREFALLEAVDWSDEELNLVVCTVSQKEDFGQLDLLFDVDFESDMEKLKQELGIVSQPKRYDYLKEYGVQGFIEQLTNVVACYGKQWASSLIESLTTSEQNTVLSEIESQHPPLFAKLISWGLGDEGLCPDAPC